ncbi:NAD-dependent epimerase/dehydratase family protein [Mucilaginibacter ginkgonis]|uniref:NAD-dependent epimerase/dehydratase family protein n=1 Tax=Mucilaginibacter ginkgonis TaxID=2682091 RepID=A0A6I4HWH1_9SPHI|nr:NAD-dependent epimerase/dehydratase family protein [Mucilaginibacter ginkgonis]QQL51306.1 NAD-dependent epimerase/dehydratase family protein [Mucilaginibacter ginkgonis]
MKERVLLTGASGFIGFHIIEALLTAGYDVTAVVRKSSKVEHLSEFAIQYTDLDFNSVDALKDNIAQNNYNYVIHAAGVTSALTPADYNYFNTTYTVNLAQAAANSGVRFVFLSSLAAIGPLKDLNGQITEATPPAPVTYYGESKLRAETEIREIEGLTYVILRPTAVYGPRERGIFIMFKQLTRGIELYIGRKPQQLSFIYCKDLADVVIKSLKQGSGGYNLSDGNAYDRNKLAEISKDVLHLRTLRINLPMALVKLIALAADKISYLTKKPAPLNTDKLNELAATNWNCSIDKARKDLDFAPRFDLYKGVKETLLWYKKENWI